MKTTKAINNNKIMLYLKKNEKKQDFPSNQTTKMRNTINLKIRKLGSRYYQVKCLFEKLNLSRDYLYFVGKQLVDEFKDQKPGLYLQTQSRRMKEALIVWFTENFYNEIFSLDLTFLNQFITKTQKPIAQIKEQSQISIKTKSDSNTKDNDQLDHQIKNSSQEKVKSFFTDALYNKEIDNFDYSCISNNDMDMNQLPSQLNNFDYQNLL